MSPRQGVYFKIDAFERLIAELNREFGRCPVRRPQNPIKSFGKITESSFGEFRGRSE
jgi:hypothetical protein